MKLNSIIKVVIISLVIYVIGNKIHDNYMNGEKEPFWVGTQEVQVCRTPYYSSKECYKLKVSLLEDKQARINVPNQGSLIVSNLTCYFAGNFNTTPRYVFCRSWDSNGQQWDFMPLWINY